MASIHLVLYFIQEKPTIFNITDGGGRLTVPELKANVNDFIKDFVTKLENADVCISLVNQEFTEYQEREEKALISRCNLQARYEIDTLQQEVKNRLLQELEASFNLEITDITTETEPKNDGASQTRDGNPFGGLS
jgi:hypothetical protein